MIKFLSNWMSIFNIRSFFETLLLAIFLETLSAGAFAQSASPCVDSECPAYITWHRYQFHGSVLGTRISIVTKTGAGDELTRSGVCAAAAAVGISTDSVRSAESIIEIDKKNNFSGLITVNSETRDPICSARIMEVEPNLPLGGIELSIVLNQQSLTHNVNLDPNDPIVRDSPYIIVEAEYFTVEEKYLENLVANGTCRERSAEIFYLNLLGGTRIMEFKEGF